MLQPLPVIDWKGKAGLPMIEAGAIEKIKGKYYMMAGTIGRNEGREGMYTLESDAPEGPFSPAEKNFDLLTSPKGALFTYFARFFPYRGKILVNHHAISKEERNLSLLKTAVVDKAGILRLGYWSGNEKLKGEKTASGHLAVDKNAFIAYLSGTFDADQGFILEGEFPSLKGDEKAALYLQTESLTGTAVALYADGKVEFTEHSGDGKPVVKDVINREIKFSAQPHFKLFLKQSLLEFYIDEVLIQCYTLPAKATGKVGMVSESKPVKNIKSWNIQRTH